MVKGRKEQLTSLGSSSGDVIQSDGSGNFDFIPKSLGSSLTIGNTTGGTDIDVSSGDNIDFQGEISLQRQGVSFLTSSLLSPVGTAPFVIKPVDSPGNAADITLSAGDPAVGVNNGGNVNIIATAANDPGNDGSITLNFESGSTNPGFLNIQASGSDLAIFHAASPSFPSAPGLELGIDANQFVIEGHVASAGNDGGILYVFGGDGGSGGGSGGDIAMQGGFGNGQTWPTSGFLFLRGATGVDGSNARIAAGTTASNPNQVLGSQLLLNGGIDASDTGGDGSLYGGDVTLASSTATTGGSFVVRGGNATGSGTGARTGGDITIQSGAATTASGTLTAGNILLNLANGSATPGTIQFQEDGYTFITIDTSGIGMVESVSDPTNIANTGFIYTKDVSSITELFYEDSDGNVTQITSGGVGGVTGLTEVLSVDNTTDGYDIVFTNGDQIVGSDGYIDLNVLSTGVNQQLIRFLDDGVPFMEFDPSASVAINVKPASGNFELNIGDGTVANNAIITTIAVTDGDTGSVTISSASASGSNRTAGDITLQAGGGSGSGMDGSINFNLTSTASVDGFIDFQENSNTITRWIATETIFGIPAFIGGTGSGGASGSDIGIIGGTGGPTDGDGGAASLIGGTGGGSNSDGGLASIAGGVPQGSGTAGNVRLTVFADPAVVEFVELTTPLTQWTVSTTHALEPGFEAVGDGRSLAIEAADNTASSTGGTLSVIAGDALVSGTGIGGDLELFAGNASASGTGNRTGGTVTISSGDGYNGDATFISGDIIFDIGNADTGTFGILRFTQNSVAALTINPDPGVVEITAAVGTGSGIGTEIEIQGGIGGATGDGGEAQLAGGTSSAAGADAGYGAIFRALGGTHNAGSPIGGTATITGGDLDGTSDGTAGGVTLQTGTITNATGTKSAGDINFNLVNTNADSPGVFFFSESGSPVITLDPGGGAAIDFLISDTAGDFQIQYEADAAANGGSIGINAQPGGATGDGGDFVVEAGPSSSGGDPSAGGAGIELRGGVHTGLVGGPAILSGGDLNGADPAGSAGGVTLQTGQIANAGASTQVAGSIVFNIQNLNADTTGTLQMQEDGTPFATFDPQSSAFGGSLVIDLATTNPLAIIGSVTTATAATGGNNLFLKAQDGGTGNTDGGNIGIQAGVAQGTGNSGDIDLITREATSTSGSTSGDIRVTTGDATSAGTTVGSIFFNLGDPGGSGTGGIIDFQQDGTSFMSFDPNSSVLVTATPPTGDFEVNVASGNFVLQRDSATVLDTNVGVGGHNTRLHSGEGTTSGNIVFNIAGTTGSPDTRGAVVFFYDLVGTESGPFQFGEMAMETTSNAGRIRLFDSSGTWLSFRNDTDALIDLGANVTAPVIQQADETTTANGEQLSIHAQNNTNGSSGDGGPLALSGGSSTAGTGGDAALASGTGGADAGELFLLRGAAVAFDTTSTETRLSAPTSGTARLRTGTTSRLAVNTTLVELNVSTLRFDTTISAPVIQQEDTGDAAGETLTIHAQDNDSSSFLAGDLDLRGGINAGDGYDGYLNLGDLSAGAVFQTTAEDGLQMLNTGSDHSIPIGGGVMYSKDGALKGRGTSGTITTMAAAEPHCPDCGNDFVVEWNNTITGNHLAVCMWCHTESNRAGVFIREAG